MLAAPCSTRPGRPDFCSFFAVSIAYIHPPATMRVPLASLLVCTLVLSFSQVSEGVSAVTHGPLGWRRRPGWHQGQEGAAWGGQGGFRAQQETRGSSCAALEFLVN